MANSYTDTESLRTMIKAIKDYKNSLEGNIKVLQNAARTCDVAMGSDDLSKKHIESLEVSIKSLAKALELSDELYESLQYELQRAEDIYNT